MEKYDVVIVGSGLGGLQCAYILSKHGMNVCVLEKNSQPGGCMQTFRRGKTVFDTGFHYVGGLAEGQPLNRLFRYFGLMDLPWHQLDESCFDEVVIGEKSYSFATGYERFVETLSQQFPHQHSNLAAYANFLHKVSDNIFNSFVKKSEEDIYGTSLFAQSAYAFLNETITDPLLRNVLSGTSLKLELNPQTLPLYIFAQINSSYIQSAWRLQGGGSQISDTLIDGIKRMGGTVLMKSNVTRLIESDGKITFAEINGDEQISADYFISDIHPSLTLSLITESKLIRNIYRKRINNLTNTYGMFTANLALKEGAVPYQNRNIYIYKNADVWDYADYKPENVNTAALVSFQVPADGSAYTRNIDILTPMYWQEVESWNGTNIGRRGDDYVALKEQKVKACIELISKQICELQNADAIDNIFTSTPLSYLDYTYTPQGSAYGIRKNYENLMSTLLSPRTPEPNLFLTGQNLNLHGVLGVSMTSFLTCAELIGIDAALQGLEI